jgi:hypothetical protein
MLVQRSLVLGAILAVDDSGMIFLFLKIKTKPIINKIMTIIPVIRIKTFLFIGFI